MIRDINFKKKNFQFFLKKIKMPLEKNNSLSEKPWIYRKKNFFFKCFITRKKVSGAIVYSKHRYNYHLNFIYVVAEKRNKKIGSKLLNYFLSLKGKRYFTTHVNKKFKRTIKFYKKNLFTQYFKYMKIKDLEIFKQASINYNSSVYKQKILFFKKNLISDNLK